MSLELTILRLLKYRDRFDKVARAVPKHVLDEKTRTILDDYRRFFAEFPDTDRIPHTEFMLWFKLVAHPTLTEEQAAVYDVMLRAVQEDVPPAMEAGLMERLVAAETAYEVAQLLQRWGDGDEVDLYVELRASVERYEAQADRKIKVPWVTNDISELLEDEKNDVGLQFRLPCINMSMRPLRGGDFIVVAARPDKGKTTFLTDTLTFMAAQVQRMFGDKKNILWFNNEGPGKRIIQRLYQSALDGTIPDLLGWHALPSATHATKLHEMYAEAVGGRADIIRILDIHDFWSHQVEDAIRVMDPALIVLDMVDNIKFGGEATNGGERTDQKLEAMYQWARVMSVKHDCPIIATSQVDNSGDGLQYPTLGMLKDSKTGKQGAAEAIIVLGASNDPLLTNSRFIGMTKNKLHRHGGPKDPRCEVLFDGSRGRYNMPGGI